MRSPNGVALVESHTKHKKKILYQPKDALTYDQSFYSFGKLLCMNASMFLNVFELIKKYSEISSMT